MQIKALALAGLLLATPAFAQSGTVPPETLAREAIGKMIEALQGDREPAAIRRTRDGCRRQHHDPPAQPAAQRGGQARPQRARLDALT